MLSTYGGSLRFGFRVSHTREFLVAYLSYSSMQYPIPVWPLVAPIYLALWQCAFLYGMGFVGRGIIHMQWAGRAAGGQSAQDNRS